MIESGSVLVQHGENEQAVGCKRCMERAEAQQVLAGTSFGMDTILFDEPYDLQVTAFTDQVGHTFSLETVFYNTAQYSLWML